MTDNTRGGDKPRKGGGASNRPRRSSSSSSSRNSKPKRAGQQKPGERPARHRDEGQGGGDRPQRRGKDGHEGGKRPFRRRDEEQGEGNRRHQRREEADGDASRPSQRRQDGKGRPPSKGADNWQGGGPGKTGGRPGVRAGGKPGARAGGKPGVGSHRRGGPAASGLEGIAARDAAVLLVSEVLNNHRPLDDVLLEAENIPQLMDLTKADRGFARAIAATSLRRLGQIDDALSNFLEKGMPENSGNLREILLIAGAQLLFLDSPPHAVINVAVQQVKRDYKARRFDKLANAVLRRLSERGKELVEKQEAARLNTPDWLWRAWVKTYGEEGAKCIGEAHLTPAMLDLTVKRDAERWATKTGARLLPTGSLRLQHKGRIERIEGFDEGAWWVQDMAAALPARLLGDVKGKRVADLASAPGGKTLQLAAASAEVVSVDWSAGRLARLKDNLERMNLKAEVIKADITELKIKEKFDAILLDAPCTATGTIRRHPDLPYLKKPQDIKELAAIQARLIDAALALLKPGGTLVFCTCSLQPEEGSEQVKALLERNKKVRLEPFDPAEIGALDVWFTSEGFLRTLPHHRPVKDMPPGMDGFFAARLTLKT